MDDEFGEIRPYVDTEVPKELEVLLGDDELIKELSDLAEKYGSGVVRHMPEFIRKIGIQLLLRNEVRGASDIGGFQRVVRNRVTQIIEGSKHGFSYEGIDNLRDETGRIDPRGFMFVSTHRDVTLDAVLLNYALGQEGIPTAKYAYRDTFASVPWVAQFMRLTQGYLVNTQFDSQGDRYESHVNLSKYIEIERSRGINLQIAERLGRTKDGIDDANPVVIRMMYRAQEVLGEAGIPFSEYIRRLNIVPVSVSYAVDPTDVMKAKEVLWNIEHRGETYPKSRDEDKKSMIAGIFGFEGARLTFGTPLREEYENARQVADELDVQIQSMHHLWASNYIGLAHDKELPLHIGAEVRRTTPFSFLEEQAFLARLDAMDPELRPLVTRAYANPVINKRRHGLF
tara:strand:+ start:5283 stop:6476 length:1194 start_codon:yes stop_codon:yes gene_type:complete